MWCSSSWFPCIFGKWGCKGKGGKQEEYDFWLVGLNFPASSYRPIVSYLPSTFIKGLLEDSQLLENKKIILEKRPRLQFFTPSHTHTAKSRNGLWQGWSRDSVWTVAERERRGISEVREGGNELRVSLMRHFQTVSTSAATQEASPDRPQCR